tara:strand:- start:1938 stop:2498 length:561 start_codon:yes stop_codon:yes gene_type:complete
MADQMKKYKLTKETKNYLGKTLFRIKATESFGSVSKGDLGGWIEKEENLLRDGDAWVYGDAYVYGGARVYGNARVYGSARVFGNAYVSGNARVFGDAYVYGGARVYGNARVYGSAWVLGNAWVSGESRLQFGWCFARKREDWEVSEVENGEEILLIKDYKPAVEEVEEMTLEEVCEKLGQTIKIIK